MSPWIRHLRLFARNSIGLAVIVAFAIAVSPVDREGWPIFLTAPNWVNILRQISEIGILALAMTFVILSAGIDLSVGSVLALAATLSARLLMDWETNVDPSVRIAVAVAVPILACGLVGAVSGAIISQFSIQPFVVTLAAMIGIRGLARWMSSNSNVQLSFDPDHVSGRFSGLIAEPATVISVFLILACLFGFLLSRTVFGRHLQAVGDNPRAAYLAGLPIKRLQIAVYTISGAMAGIAGVLHCAQNSQGNPNDGVAYELDAIAAVVIGGTSLMGGKGSILATVIGTLMLGVITNILGLKGVDENVKWMAKAVIIVVAVLLQQTRPFNRQGSTVGRKRQPNESQ